MIALLVEQIVMFDTVLHELSDFPLQVGEDAELKLAALRKDREMLCVSSVDHKLCARKSSSWETMKSLGVAPLQENFAGEASSHAGSPFLPVSGLAGNQ
jgi:hypothetical protein